MRMIPIDIVVKLSVCARDWDEALETAKRGMRMGRYADDAQYLYAGEDPLPGKRSTSKKEKAR